jgi:hypothetical protein
MDKRVGTVIVEKQLAGVCQGTFKPRVGSSKNAAGMVSPDGDKMNRMAEPWLSLFQAFPYLSQMLMLKSLVN